MAQKIFFNGEIVDTASARLSVTDAGFLYGAGLFETMRAGGGVVFAIEDHIDRLIFSADVLDIKLAGGKQYLIDSVYKTLDANGLRDARLRLTASSGPMGLDEPEPTVFISAASFEPYPQQYYKKGVMATLSQARQNPTDPTAGHKTTSYFSRLLSLSEAHKKGAAEAIWFTIDNRLAEGCVSNVFVVKDSVVYTPPIKTPVLPGIVRKHVCCLAVKNSIEFVEKDLYIHDLLGADEVFLTNVIMQVMPVIRIEAHDISDAKPGTVTKKMSELFIVCVDDYRKNYPRNKK